jgi:hypothetical protein
MSKHRYSLSEWQLFSKPKEEIIYNCSVVNGSDSWLDFTIGVGYKYIMDPEIFIKNQVGEHDELVLCAIETTTDGRRRMFQNINRKKIISTLQNNQIENKRIEPHYFNVLSDYKFIISPEGNGIDCHRHYESLLHGCIPIVEYNEKIQKKYEGCPILYTKDYSEITREYLENKYKEMIYQTWDFSKLFLSEYPENTIHQIKHNGNYWSKRLTGNLWYNN